LKKIDKYCKNCHKQLWESNKTGYCRTCFNKIVKKTVKDSYCIDCGALLNKYKPGKRCYSCNRKHQLKINPLIGKKNPNWKGGIIFKKHFCEHCGKEISISSWYKNKLCNSCSRGGSNNCNWKGGLPKCIDCGKKLSTYTATRCKKCANKHNSGKNHHNYGKSVKNIKKIKYGSIWFRSSWEANFAKWCDLSGIKWEYEPKAFELIIKNKETTYTPDFYLPEFDLWIEIKGWWRRNGKNKFNWFKKNYKNIQLFQHNKLKNMSILRY